MAVNFENLGGAVYTHKSIEENLSKHYSQAEFISCRGRDDIKSALFTMTYTRWRIVASFLGLSTREAYDIWKNHADLDNGYDGIPMVL